MCVSFTFHQNASFIYFNLHDNSNNTFHWFSCIHVKFTDHLLHVRPFARDTEVDLLWSKLIWRSQSREQIDLEVDN